MRNQCKERPSKIIKRSFKSQSLDCFAFGFYMLVFLTHGVAGDQSCCSVCQCKAQEVWCEERGLASVPVGIPTYIKRLYLFNNNISSVPVEAFANLQSLELLDLRSNELTTEALNSKTFSGLHQLQDLLLSKNRISRIHKSTFSGMKNLVRLYVEDNALEEIEVGSFSNFHHLLELKLSRNRLAYFPQIVNCTSLRRLQINKNRLVRLQPRALSHLNLEELALSHNLLNQLPSSVFSVVMNMRELDLSRNRISRIPRIISKMSSLRALNLSGNPVASLPHDFLSSLRRMKVLDVSGMQLTSLPEGFIPRRVYLNIFGISNNPWRCDCSIAWLVKYMRILEGVFVRRDQIRCNGPSELDDRRLSTLLENDLNCDEFATDDSIDGAKTSPSGPDANGACDGFSCANGGECVLKQGSPSPSCRCLPGWSGVFCETVTLGITQKKGAFGNELLIAPGSVTAHSVKIVFPNIRKEMKVTAVEMTDDGLGWSIMKMLNPETNVYTLDGLKSKTNYRICVSSAGVSDPTYSDGDSLCVNITTSDLGDDATRNSVSKHAESAEFDVSDKNNQAVDGDGTGERSDTSRGEEFDLLYPIIGACAAVFVILVCGVILVAYRRKRERSLSDANCDRIVDEPMNEKLMQLTLGQADPGFDTNTRPGASPNNISNVFDGALYDGAQYRDPKRNHFYTCPRRFEANTSNRHDSLCKCGCLNEEISSYSPTVFVDKGYQGTDGFEPMDKTQLGSHKVPASHGALPNNSRFYNLSSPASPDIVPLNPIHRQHDPNTINSFRFSNAILKHPQPASGFEPAPAGSITCDNLLENQRLRLKDNSIARPSADGFLPSSNLQLQKQLADKNFYLNYELHNYKVQSASFPSSGHDTREPNTSSTIVI